MKDEWNGKERRYTVRRFVDTQTCPYHQDQSNDLKELKKQSSAFMDRDKIDLKMSGKLDRWIFTLYISSISVLVMIAATIFSWLTLKTFENAQNIFIVQVNQQRLMEHFDVPYTKNVEEAKEILTNGEKKGVKGTH